MNRSELAAAVADAADVPADIVDRVLTGLEGELVRQASAGADVKWPGLFTLNVVQRSERTGRNPQTGEQLTIPERREARLRVGSRLKRAAQSDRHE
jgi:DNA-binding protein HU-beta